MGNDTLNMSCPSGGSFYACASGSKFVGCCDTNPCGANGCPAGLLQPASFDATQYGQFSDQQCNAGLFYTCIYATQNNATFMGCCQSNACSNGQCAAGDLAGAFLSNNPDNAAPFLALNGTVATTTSSVMTTASATVTSTPSATSASAPHHHTNIGAVVGGAVGGFAILVALILGLLFLRRRHHRRNESPRQQPQMASYADQQQPGKPMIISIKPEIADIRAEHYFKPSPHISQYSPQPPYSPGPPSYLSPSEYGHESLGRQVRHISYEMPVEEPRSELAAGLGISNK